VTRQANTIIQLLSAARLGRIADSQGMAGAQPYTVAEYMADVKRAVWGPSATPMELDAGRRTMHRVYLERLEALINPPAPPAGAAGPPAGPTGPFLGAPNVPRSDFPAIARSQVRAIRDQARAAATVAAAGSLTRAHWQDIGDRADRILEPR
jgi:hypothetical protein